MRPLPLRLLRQLTPATDLWAAAAAGKKYGRFFGFVVAFWVVCAWTSFVASTAQATVNFMLSELVVFDTFFPDGIAYTNIKLRAVVWICSEVCLFFAILSNCMSRTSSLPPRLESFRPFADFTQPPSSHGSSKSRSSS